MVDPDDAVTDRDVQSQRCPVERNECVEIFHKYDSAEFDVQYDDETFDVYQRTDRHGFTHERESRMESSEDEKAKSKELKRERKWLKMLQRWSKYDHSVKLKRSIYKGIPQKFRAEVWRRLLNIDGQKMLGLYEQLRLRARHCAKDVKQIDLDINRTYRNHIFYRNRYGFKQRSLLNVLSAYSLFNCELGYCQGMNHIAALLLMYFVEEDAFWALHILMCDNSHAMHGFFVPGFPKLLRFQQHHDTVLKKQLPRMKTHLDGQGIHSGLYTTKWFFQCFLDRVPFSLALRLWDIFMLEGDLLLTVMAFTVVKLHERQLLRMNFEQAMEFLQVKLEKNFGLTNDAVVLALQKATTTLARKGLLHPPAPSRSETPSEPMGAIVLQKRYDDQIAADNWQPVCSRFAVGHSDDELSYGIVPTTLPSQVNNDLLNNATYYNNNKANSQSGPCLPVTNADGAALPHVPSYYDNLQTNFCCSSDNGHDVCKHSGSIPASAHGRAAGGPFHIEVGSDYITRIRIDTP